MPKPTNIYICSQCAAELSKWSGQCPDCGEWDTLVESTPPPPKLPGLNARGAGYAGSPSEVRNMTDVCLDQAPRLSTGMHELNRVLGGGLVPGSVVLIGGDPGGGR